MKTNFYIFESRIILGSVGEKLTPQNANNSNLGGQVLGATEQLLDYLVVLPVLPVSFWL